MAEEALKPGDTGENSRFSFHIMEYFRFCVLFLMAVIFTVRPRPVLLAAAVVFTFITTVHYRGMKLRLRKGVHRNRIRVLGLFYGYVLVLSVLLGSLSGENTWEMVLRISWALLLLLAITQVKDFASIIGLYKLILLACACVGLLEYLTKVTIWSYLGLNVTGNFQYGRNRISVIFYNPLIYSSFLLIAVWAEICYPFKKKSLHYPTLVLLLSNLVFTDSRSAWGALALGMLIACAGKKFHTRFTTRQFLYGIALAAGLLVCAYLMRFQIQKLIQAVMNRLGGTSTKEGSFIQRTGIIRNTLQYFASHPMELLVGNGYGYAGIFIREHPVVHGFYAIDNQYIYYALNYGILGLGLFLTATFWRLPTLIATARKRESRFALLCLSSVACSFLFYDAMSWPSFLICYAFTYGAVEHAMGALQETKCPAPAAPVSRARKMENEDFRQIRELKNLKIQ